MKKIILFTILMFTVACQQKDEQVSEDVTNNDQPKVKIEPKQMYCTKDLKICPEGNSVSRNANNNCEFYACNSDKKQGVEKHKPKKKEPMMCTADVKTCADGSYVSRDHYNNCKFKDCPDGVNQKVKI